MKPLTRREAGALANLDEVGQAETNREQWWHMLPLNERERAMGLAGLTREHAHWPIAKFSEAERERVRFAVARHVMQMQAIEKCMAPTWATFGNWLH